MKLKTMLYGLTLMLGCFVLASCVNDDEGPCLPDSNGKTQIVFSLVMQDNAQTRAWGVPQANDRENGEGKENDIDLSTLKLLIFDNEGAYVGTLSNTEIEYVARKTGTLPYEETVYECIGTINPDKITLNKGVYKFVFLANYTGSIPTDQQGKITWESLKTAVFTPDIANFNSNTELIPMWGVMTTPALTLEPGNRQDLGDVALLRAMSKVTVALTGTATKMDGFGYISKVEVTNYNKKGYVVPKLEAYSSVTSTIALDEEECVNENTADAATKLFINGSTDTKELTFYLLDFVNKEKAVDAQAQLIVTLGKTVEGKEVTKTFDFAPIKFCVYKDGAPTATAYDIVRNHYYKFNITEVVGGLYVKPTVANWNDAPVLDYTINMSTNMRLFDSWLYRYDTDNKYDDWGNWATSHMVVSDGRINVSSETEPIAGRPLHSPQIQLVTTGTGTFELFVDNTDFEIVRANKNDVGVVTSYEASSNGKLTIAAGTNVYTYFYIVPKLNTVPSEPVAKVFLYYNDPVLGKQEVTYNYSSLPGYSDDSSEIWAYFVKPDKYNDEQGYMKMYYQDAAHPLVPVPTVNP